MHAHDPNRLLILGRTNWRDRRQLFGIRQEDRFYHTYIIGKTGTGKSTLMDFMARQDVLAEQGFALLDPHGDLVERLAAWFPEDRKEKLIYFNVPDRTRPMGFNPLADVAPENRHLAASGLLDAMKKIWADTWGPRLEHILRNALLTLLDQPQPSLADVLRLLDDREYRRRAVERTSNEQVRAFWRREYEAYPARFRAEAIAPIQNKVGAFLSNPVLRPILTQSKSAFDPRRVMDEGRMLLVNLAKGRIGEDAAALLGALLVSRLGLAGLSRADSPPESRRDFFLYLDEFQTFTTLSLANMLSELRKYRVGLVMAHQYLGQLDEQVRQAVMGNVGTKVLFRVGAEDAETLRDDTAAEVHKDDISRVPYYEAYIVVTSSGVSTQPFSVRLNSAL
jgi:Type IV secretion-system coupling protein DNA-binding domain